MGLIRPFVLDDIPRVIELNKKLFPRSAGLPHDTQRAILHDAFLKEPWYDESAPSMVYEEPRGTIVGFVGVMSRRMVFEEKPIRLVVSQRLMVDPESRSSMASMELLRRVLAGPQDFFMADAANDISQKLWERLGGTTSPVHSIYWRRLLRPAAFAGTLLGKQTPWIRTMSVLARPASVLIDIAANKIASSPLRVMPTSTQREDLTVDTLLECVSVFSKPYSLRPVYDRSSLQMLIQLLELQKHSRKFIKTLVRDSNGRILGWYMYYLDKSGAGEVIQLGATDGSISNVLDTLLCDASEQGAVEVTGRLIPKYMKTFMAKSCLFIPGRMWTLVHSRNSSLLESIYRGNAFLTRLEGDFWLT